MKKGKQLILRPKLFSTETFETASFRGGFFLGHTQ